MTNLSKLISSVLENWAPARTTYRDEFNDAARQALRHVALHGDTTFIARLALGVPSHKYRADIVQRLETQFAFKINPEKKFSERRGGTSLKVVDLAKFELLKKLPQGSEHGKTQSRSTSGWYAKDPRFRQDFTDLVIQELTKIKEHNNPTRLNLLLLEIPDEAFRDELVSRILSLGPLVKADPPRFVGMRKGFLSGDWPDLSTFRVFPRITYVRDDVSIQLGSDYCTVNEFVEDVADILTLNRTAFSTSQLAMLGNVILNAARSKNK